MFPIPETAVYLYELSQGKADQRTGCLGFNRFLLIGPGLPRFRSCSSFCIDIVYGVQYCTSVYIDAKVWCPAPESEVTGQT